MCGGIGISKHELLKKKSFFSFILLDRQQLGTCKSREANSMAGLDAINIAKDLKAQMYHSGAVNILFVFFYTDNSRMMILKEFPLDQY